MKKLIPLLILTAIISSCSTKTEAATTLNSDRNFETKSVASNLKKVNSTNINGFVLDEQDKKIMEKTSPITVERMQRHEPLTLGDIIKLSQNGVSNDTIIGYLKYTYKSYNLSQSQINRMHESGVSKEIVNYMITTGK